MFKTIGVWFLNFLIGIVGTAILITKLTGRGEGIAATGNSASFKVNMDITGFIIWIVIILVYFFGAKKFWGKTVGGFIADAVMGKKK
ncbi:MAG: hypothetical protein ACD_38C00169G0006 [uncultured bacterium]|uniref:Uncharacterized protein n=1 Tax=Candidatus Daviesbacteria bacterium GW2011_GWC2_40_12 TaxID=1618431 RepID=A0A0G0T482_9BACT|nr:MAG: hypothetical protein ACD_38C00169G0006 [uncultured bacterium]KKR16136.1 MAG: hypothetical protein UT45_C0008G0011 [Candidatus Daviesbacteria bacterium GW2011_GWA2_39_33]KKR41915.1 MAG: hypothetical protein UT77_C0005G0030 [Candidatus Daviesbacteria bacterium GW2011_GWC2_40_12]OGE21788.1 MAG: hypothetical protein A2778_04955 [Candidatus Daviesbacteria bacterium RIFCSPHIGHO2_01_FULL_40_24]OGE29460.1 MAG: hypothetical protein A3C29_00350 [Candidatus Daviesbacteria bacterium RIFCSPHIGHO2_02